MIEIDPRSKEDTQSYLGQDLLSGLSSSSESWEWGTGHTPLRRTWLWVGNLSCWRKQAKAHVIDPRWALASPVMLVANHTSLRPTVTARLEKACCLDQVSGAGGFSSLFLAVFWEFLKKTLSFRGWFHKLGEKQLLVVHSSDFPEKCRISAGHHDDRFYRFPPFPPHPPGSSTQQ